MESYIAGFVSGIVQTLVGHPLDTLKVSKQNNTQLNLNPKTLYRGVLYPLSTNSIICSINFGVYNQMKEYYPTVIAGAISGIPIGILITPVELYKTNRQLSIPINCHAWKGLSTCLLREIPAFAIYFQTYEYMKKKDYGTLVSGGVAGTLCWVGTYPMDVIKTRVQSGRSKTIIDAVRMGQFNKGFSYCIARGCIVNAMGFYAYEYTLNIQSKHLSD